MVVNTKSFFDDIFKVNRQIAFPLPKVTDGEIDRVLLALLDFCFSEIQKPKDDKIRAK